MRGSDHSTTREKRIELEQEKDGTSCNLPACSFFADREHRKVEDNISQTKTMTVRISRALSKFVASNVGETGPMRTSARTCAT